jgi:uncharacterized protein with beta-barrel porin domain
MKKIALFIFLAVNMAVGHAATTVLIYSKANMNGSDSSPGQNNESANLASIVQYFINDADSGETAYNENGTYANAYTSYDFSGFVVDSSLTDFNDVGLQTKLDNASFLFMPDMEGGFNVDTTDLPASARTTIANWVNGGGVLFMTGTGGSKDADFLNAIFGWDTSSVSDVTTSLVSANASGTAFADGPATLSTMNASDALNGGTVSGFTPIYGTSTAAHVATISYGLGTVIYAGFDYYGTGIAGTGFEDAVGDNFTVDVTTGYQAGDDWVQQIIPRALQYSAAAAEAASSSDPTTKADVVGNIEATYNLAIGLVDTSLTSIHTRLSWLRRNKNSTEKSYQGIKVGFSNPLVDQFVNGTQSGFEPLQTADASAWFQKYSNSPDQILTDAEGRAIEIAMAKAKEQLGEVNLNPTGGPIFGQWSGWTEGRIQVGKKKATSTSSGQDSDVFTVTLGADRPFGENALLGMAATIGKGDVDVGNLGSGVESDNYSFSIYSAFRPENLPLMEAVLGVGHMQIDTTRMDGAQTLTGGRDSNSLYGSFAVHQEPFRQGDVSFAPYGKVEAAYIEFDAYSESGGSQALAFDKSHINWAMVSVGADVNYEMPLAGGKLRPFGKVEYGVDITGTTDVDMHYVSDTATNYRLGMERAATSHWLFGVGADYEIKDDLSSTIAYERSQAINSGHADTLRLKLNWQF